MYYPKKQLNLLYKDKYMHNNDHFKKSKNQVTVAEQYGGKIGMDSALIKHTPKYHKTDPENATDDERPKA